jgi:hypothetical protein
MLKIIEKTGVDEEVIEILKVHNDSYNIKIDTGNDGVQDIILAFEYEENILEEEKALYAISLDHVEWIRNKENECTHQEIFDFSDNFINEYFNDFSEDDKNNLHAEIMAEIENYCDVHNIEGIA